MRAGAFTEDRKVERGRKRKSEANTKLRSHAAAAVGPLKPRNTFRLPRGRTYPGGGLIRVFSSRLVYVFRDRFYASFFFFFFTHFQSSFLIFYLPADRLPHDVSLMEI